RLELSGASCCFLLGAPASPQGAMSVELAVQCTKLPEWLLARRVIPDNYATLMPGIDAKVAQALEEAVSDATAQALIGEHREAMSYFAARDIYEAIAKSPEG
ncbi:unnamed protein product, partial [Prorocentrum cordatum]